MKTYYRSCPLFASCQKCFRSLARSMRHMATNNGNSYCRAITNIKLNMPSRAPTDTFRPRHFMHSSLWNIICHVLIPSLMRSYFPIISHSMGAMYIFGNCPACLTTKTAYACSCEAHLHCMITTRCTPGVQDVLLHFSQYMQSSTSKRQREA